MITLYEKKVSTGTLTPTVKNVDKKGKKKTTYLCDYKSDVNSCYDNTFQVREKELEFF